MSIYMEFKPTSLILVKNLLTKLIDIVNGSIKIWFHYHHARHAIKNSAIR